MSSDKENRIADPVTLETGSLDRGYTHDPNKPEQLAPKKGHDEDGRPDEFETDDGSQKITIVPDEGETSD